MANEGADPARALAGLDLAPLVWFSSSLIVAIADSAGVLVRVNPAFQRLAGYDPRGQNIVETVGEGQSDAFSAWFFALNGQWASHTWSALPDGNRLPHDFTFAACRAANDTYVLIGEPLPTTDLALALLDVNEDLVEEHRRLGKDRERLDRIAQQDELTGLANRRSFDGRLAREIELASDGRSFALVMLDIDHFKALNDMYGHPAGDSVLRWLGGLIRSAARRDDLVARYGGEEFVAILPATDVSDAASWANRLRRAISHGRAPSINVGITVSFGVSVWHQGDTASDVLGRADRSLYAAKRSGRNRVAREVA